jgi:hypothetical protein
MSLPLAPEAPFLRGSAAKPARLRHPRVEFCSCDKGPLLLAPTSPNPPFSVAILPLLGVGAKQSPDRRFLAIAEARGSNNVWAIENF